MHLREPDDNSRGDIAREPVHARNVDSQNPHLPVVELFMKEAGLSSSPVMRGVGLMV